MRRHILLLALALPAAFFAEACTSDDSKAPSAAAPDAGLALDGAPTNESGPTPVGDASPDAPSASGVEVQVLTDVTVPVGVPGLSGPTRVLLHDANGAVTAQLTPDANGKVIASPAPMLTVIAPSSEGRPRLVTYVDVQLGDRLIVDVRSAAPGALAQPATLNVTWPGTTGTATTYDVTSGAWCGSASTNSVAAPTALTLSTACPSVVTLLGTAYDDGGDVVGFSNVKNVTVPAPGASAGAALGAWAAPTTVTISATNLPVGDASSVFAAADGASLFQMNGDTGGSLPSGVTYAAPAGLDLQAAVRVETDRGSADFATLATIRRVAATTAVAIDFADVLPRITAGSASTDATRPEITWTAASSLASTDGGYVSINWVYRFDPDNADSPSWTFVVPPQATSVKAPELPADLAEYGPPGNYNTEVEYTGTLFVEGDALEGYAALRKLPVQPLRSGSALTSFNAPLPTIGKLRVTTHNVEVGY